MEQGNQNLLSIQEKSILNYIDRMWEILPFVFSFCALMEAMLFFLTSGKSYTAEDPNYIKKSWTLFESFLPTILSFAFYFPCYRLYKNKRSNFHMKKTYYQTILYLSISSYVFIHNGYTILLAMYIVPIITSCAFGKSAVMRSLKYSTLCIIIYALVQTIRTHSSFYIPISAIIEMIVVFSTLIALNMSQQYNEVFAETAHALQHSDELTNKLHTDSLTNSYTREKLEEDIKNNVPAKSIAFVDIDNFKNINDKHGHDKGDWVLEEFVWIVSEEGISIYRFGGDEFVISSSQSAEELYERIVYKTENFKYETKKKLGQAVTISCGIIHTEEFTHESIKRADELMYEIKKTGKNLIKILD